MARITNKRNLAKAVLAVVDAEEHYDQDLWISARYFNESGEATGTGLRKTLKANVCGTTACVAGNAVVLSMPAKAKVNFAFDEVKLPDGQELSIDLYGQYALGLTDDESAWLFASYRSVDEVRAALIALSKGKDLEDVMYA